MISPDTMKAFMALLFLVAPGHDVRADEPVTAVDTSRWNCNFCLYPWGWHGSLDVGPGNVSDSSPKFGDYRGLEEEGGFGSIDGDLHYLNGDGVYFDLYARNLGLDSRQLEMRGGRQGRYEIHLSLNEIPRFLGNGTATPYTGAGTETLALPANWQAATTTGGMTALASALSPVPLSTSRKTLDTGVTVRLASNWSYEVDIERSSKEGTRPFGSGVFTIHSSHLPAPVDYTTDRISMSLAYTGKSGQLRAGIEGSWFENGASSLTWENPFTPIPGTETLRAALEPDNDFYQFSLNGAWAPSPRIRLSGRAAVGRMKQDDLFQPYSSNPEFSELPLPRRSLGGKIDTATLNLAGKLNARLARKLDLVARVKLNERDNRTAVDLFTPVITDLVTRPETPNRPYSFDRLEYSLEMRYRVSSAVRLRAGASQREIDRTLQSVEETDETTLWGEASFSPWSSAQFRVRLEKADRDISPYETIIDPGLVEQALMRKFNLADRDRDRVLVELELAPTDRLSISLSYYRANDDYDKSILGLHSSVDRNYSIDAAYAVSRKMSLYAFFSRDEIDADLSGAKSPVALPWNSITRDRFNTLGAGLTSRINDKLDLSLDYVLSESDGDITTRSGGTDSDSGEAPFPTLTTDLRNLRLLLDYRVSDHWNWKLLAEHEKYDSADWSIDGLGVDGISKILTMGGTSPDYNVTVLRLLASYRF